MKIRIDDILEIAIDVAPEIREALRKDSDGGRKVTKAEAKAIGAAVTRALLAQAGDVARR